MSLLSSSKPTSWAGTDAIERQFYSVRNALVDIYLSGVKGISTPVPGHEYKLVPREAAEGYLEKGRKVLRWMEDQRRGPTTKARRYMENSLTELRRLLGQAEAVYRGGRPKMTAEDYRKYRESLGLGERR
jgi:hypothetical protein